MFLFYFLICWFEWTFTSYYFIWCLTHTCWIINFQFIIVKLIDHIVDVGVWVWIFNVVISLCYCFDLYVWLENVWWFLVHSFAFHDFLKLFFMEFLIDVCLVTNQLWFGLKQLIKFTFKINIFLLSLLFSLLQILFNIIFKFENFDVLVYCDFSQLFHSTVILFSQDEKLLLLAQALIETQIVVLGIVFQITWEHGCDACSLFQLEQLMSKHAEILLHA